MSKWFFRTDGMLINLDKYRAISVELCDASPDCWILCGIEQTGCGCEIAPCRHMEELTRAQYRTKKYRYEKGVALMEHIADCFEKHDILTEDSLISYWEIIHDDNDDYTDDHDDLEEIRGWIKEDLKAREKK